MLIKFERPIPATDNPTHTGAKRLARFKAGLDESRYYDRKNHPRTISFPGIDLARLRRAYGPETAGMPRLQQGTFKVPLGITPSQFEQWRNVKVADWLNELGKAGFELKPWPGRVKPIRVYPGIYPAIDLNGGYPILDMREFIVEGYFSYRHSKPLTLELPREVIDPLVVNA